MISRISIANLLLCMTLICFGQDSVSVDFKIIYTKNEINNLTRKGFHGQYGREDIIFSEKHKQIEYCYYVDNERYCVGNHYWLVNDSTILIGDSSRLNDYDFVFKEWNFKKSPNGNFLLYKQLSDSYEFVEVETLMPIKYIGKKITTTANRKDTLWTTSYMKGIYFKNHPFLTPVEEFYKSNILGKIHEYYQVDIPPTQLNSLSLNEITIENMIPCLCEPYELDIGFVSCIITKEGNIKNIEGHYSSGCPYTMMEIIKEISAWENINPAYIKGEPVNVRWFITVNNRSRNFLHPVFADTYKNRKRYLKNKRKQKPK